MGPLGEVLSGTSPSGNGKSTKVENFFVGKTGLSKMVLILIISYMWLTWLRRFKLDPEVFMLAIFWNSIMAKILKKLAIVDIAII